MPKVMNIKAIEDYIREWGGKKLTSVIARELNVSESMVRNHGKKMKISMELPGRAEKNKLIDEAILKHHRFKTVRQISDLIGASPGIITYHGQVLGKEFKQFKRGPGKAEPVRGNKFFYVGKLNWLV